MTAPPPPSNSTANPWKLRALLILSVLVCCLPPLAHSRFIEPRLDLLRHPSMGYMLPFTLLALRYFGQWSAGFPIFFATLFGWSFFRPAAIRLPFVLAIGVGLTFLAAYICYALLLIGAMVVSEQAAPLR